MSTATAEGMFALTLFQGRTADRTPAAIAGAQRLAKAMSEQLNTALTITGTPRDPLNDSGLAQLESARLELQQLADTLQQQLNTGQRPVTILPLCAGALATLPVIAKHHPDACLLWLDAHGDLNTPTGSESGYLGGMVVAAAAGLWDSGLGSGWRLDQVILADGRDLDATERQLIEHTGFCHLPHENLTPEALSSAIGDRPVYVHLDCDLLAPGFLPTDYSVAGGPSLEQLHALCHAIGEHELIGLEIAEFEEQPDFEMAKAAERLCSALSPLLAKLRRRTL